jgi:hypothetical protein
MTKTKVIEAAKRLRKACVGFNFEILDADANDPDDRPRDLTPWIVLALAVLDEEAYDESR